MYNARMKPLFATLMIISFTAVTLLGAFGMHLGMQSHDGNCIFAAAKGVDCPKGNSLIAYLNFHLDAYKDFSLTLLSYLLLALSLSASIFTFYLFKPLRPHFAKYRVENSHSHKRARKLTRWLSLRENSPNSL